MSCGALTFGIMTLSQMGLFVRLGINDTQHNILNIMLLSITALSIPSLSLSTIMLSIAFFIMLSVLVMNVVMLSVSYRSLLLIIIIAEI